MSAAFRPLTDQKSLQEGTYEALRAALLEGRYLPGERIYEAVVAKALGVSRNPVREAVRRLQQDGLLEVRPHNGIFVASIQPEEIEDVYRIRGALEAIAAELAAERMTDREIEHLHRIVAEQRRAAQRAVAQPEAPVSASQADRFHRAIHLGARNARLLTLLEQIYAQVTHFRNLTLRVPGRAAVSAQGHEWVYEAIQARDPAEADRRMRLHVDDARQALLLQIRATDHGDGVDGGRDAWA